MGTEFPLYRAAGCGLLAMLVGVGIARFGYAPLVPALVAAHWYSASAAFWLGAVNLLGYLLGAGVMRSWRRRIWARPVVAGMMGLTALSLGASAWNAGAIYFGFWRLLSGMAGGALMVLMAAAITGRAPAARRGQVGGITFAGMGVGIMLSGLVIPRLLPLGLPATWLLLGAFGLAATIVVAVFMPGAVIEPGPRQNGERGLSRPVLLLMIGYSVCALGFMPHMLFFSSFIAIGLGRGVAAGADGAAALGLAAAVGPPVLGRIADRYGFLPTLGVAYLVMAAAVALPLVVDSPLGLGVSAFFVGAVALGAVMLTSGALAHLVPPGRLAASWGLATMAYAVAQALVAAGFSVLYHHTGSFLVLFAIGAVATAISGGLIFAAQKSV